MIRTLEGNLKEKKKKKACLPNCDGIYLDIISLLTDKRVAVYGVELRVVANR